MQKGKMMTPEEKAMALVEGHNPLHGDGILFHKGELTALLGAQLVCSVAQAIREAKAEAYEAAAREVCSLCRDGSLLHGGRGFDFYHPEASVETRGSERVFVASACAVRRIHALKESLALTTPET